MWHALNVPVPFISSVDGRLGDRAKQPSGLSRTLSRALNITVPTAGQVKSMNNRRRNFIFPTHHLGGFEGDWGVYCCACKERAVSGHGKAGVYRVRGKKDGGFTYHPQPKSGTTVDGRRVRSLRWVFPGKANLCSQYFHLLSTYCVLKIHSFVATGLLVYRCLAAGIRQRTTDPNLRLQIRNTN